MNKKPFLLGLIVTSLMLQACSDDSDNTNYDDSSESSSTQSQNQSQGQNQSQSSEASSVNSSSAPIALSGAELYAQECSGCHGSDGNGSTPLSLSRTTEALASFIDQNMPKGNAANCVDACALAVAEYINGGFGQGTATTPTPSFKLDPNAFAQSYKAAGDKHLLRWQNGETTVAQQDGWQWLYTFKNDSYNMSVCNAEGCLTSWEPLLTDASATLASPFGAFERDDNHWQITLNGMPLYAKAADATSAVWNNSWPLATDHPIATENSWLQAYGHVWTLASDAPAWANLTDRSVYIKTSEGVCGGACLNNWPALLASDGATAIAPFSLVARDDTDRMQWAYQGEPLYIFASDGPGEALGADLMGWQRAVEIPVMWNSNAEGRYLAAAGYAAVWSQQADGSWASEMQGRQGYTLYINQNDSAENGLACTANCAESWPPLMAHENAKPQGKYSLVARGDSYQWAYEQQPLYLYAQDAQPGELKDTSTGPWQVAGWAPNATPSTISSTTPPISPGVTTPSYGY